MASHSVGAYDAKTHLPRLLDQVEGGDTITITKHGRPVARLVPVSSAGYAPTEVIQAVRAARVGVRRGAETVREMIAYGRR
jgi:prevent-host-death family protein